MKLTLLYRGMIMLVFLAACSGLPAAPTETNTMVSDTQTVTPTIIWFPATDTPTFFPTQAMLSTQDLRPGLGELLFTDNFDQADLWNTSKGANSSATVIRNQLLLSISGQGPVTMASLRSQPTLADFYAEAIVKLNLCGDKDQFGMLFRAAFGDNYYRFVVSCDGQTRLERMVSGSRVPLNTWLSSGDAPIAAPAEVKLGVWAAGSEMRFFLNDHMQFTFRDTTLRNGTLGFFIFANGAAPITASFSELSVYPVLYVSPVPSLTPSRTPTSTRTPIPTRSPTP